jgi:hypothetical protein
MMGKINTKEQNSVGEILKTLVELNEKNELQGIVIGGLFRNGEAYTGWSKEMMAQPLYALGVMKLLSDTFDKDIYDNHLRPADSVITPAIEDE